MINNKKALTDSRATVDITSLDQFNQLLGDGFEVKSVRFYGHPQRMNCSLVLLKDNEEIVANANAIDDFVLHLRELYDFDKQKPCFVYISDTEVYHNFEEELFTIIPGTHVQPMLVKKIISSSDTRTFNKLQDWITREKGKKYGIKNLSEIFFLVCILEEKDGVITRTTLSKESLTLSRIQILTKQADNLDMCIALSFILISSKVDKSIEGNDTLIGIVLYDLKKKESIAFNIQSLISYVEENSIQKDEGLYDVVNDLFTKTINDKMECNSFLPLAIDSPCYTVLPWICYSVLLPINLDKNKNGKFLQTITIPEFFAFGYPTLPDEESSLSLITSR